MISSTTRLYVSERSNEGTEHKIDFGTEAFLGPIYHISSFESERKSQKYGSWSITLGIHFFIPVFAVVFLCIVIYFNSKVGIIIESQVKSGKHSRLRRIFHVGASHKKFRVQNNE